MIVEAGRPCRMDPGVSVYRYLDSTEVAQSIDPRSKFKEMYLIDSDPCYYKGDVPFGFGRYSTQYAIKKSRQFLHLGIQDLFETQKGNIDWRDVNAFFDVGVQLKSPGSVDSLARLLAPLKISGVSNPKYVYGVDKSPLFGLFYKDNCGKSYIYGLKMKLEKDSINIEYQEIYFSFDVPLPDDFSICNASAVYIRDADSLKIKDRYKIEKFVQENRDTVLSKRFLSERGRAN
jgi:hypothetical protein